MLSSFPLFPFVGDPRSRAKNSVDRHERLTGDRSLLRGAQSFVRFRDDVIDYGFHVLRPLPNRQLSVRAGAFAHDSLDMRHLPLRPEFVYFSRNELEQLI
jgi:hypothetical protein